MPRERQSDTTALQRGPNPPAEIRGPHLLTPRLILRWCLLFRLKEGKWPGGEAVVWDRTSSRTWVRVTGESWPAITKALQVGIRGLAALRGTTLGDLRRRHGLDPQLNKDQVVAWITLFRNKEARWPNHTDDCVWEQHPRQRWIQRPNSTWLGISVSLGCGLKDCEPMSLNQFQLTVVNRPARPKPRRRSQQPKAVRRSRRPRSKYPAARKPALTQAQLVLWIKGFHRKTGRYPIVTDKAIWEQTGRKKWTRVRGETWAGVQHALRTRQRGLHTLGRPFTLKRFRILHGLTRDLTESQLVTWITLFHEKEGRYPTVHDRVVWEKTARGKWRRVRRETWHGLSASLTRGARGLDAWRGSSLAQFRQAHGLHRDLSESRVVRWIRAFHEKESRWPTQTDKTVWERKGGRWRRVARETWTGINLALLRGTRGLEEVQGESLLSLRRKHALIDRPLKLTDAKVISWAQEFHRRRERWPTERDSTVWVPDASGGWTRDRTLTWRKISNSLQERSGAKRTTLGRLKRKYGLLDRAAFTAAGVERWIRLYRNKEQHWPTSHSIVVWDHDEQTKVWCAVVGVSWDEIDRALLRGSRGLQALKGSSLEKFRYQRRLADPLSAEQVLIWARCFKVKETRYPWRTDTHVWEQDDHQQWQFRDQWTWGQIDRALAQGYLGPDQPPSLAEFCESHGLIDENPPPKDDRRLSADQIRQWLVTFKAHEGRWPTKKDRQVLEEVGPGVHACVVGENWKALDEAMVLGLRGLTELKGTRLTQLRAQHGWVDDRTLTPETIAQWMQDFRKKTGGWPTDSDRTIWAQIPGTEEWVEVAGETWGALRSTLRHGRRGLKDFKGLTLTQFRVKQGLEEDRILTVVQILVWMRLFHDKEERWPTQRDFTVWENPRKDVWVEVENENWARLDDALRRGLRGLEEHTGSSLAKLKKEHNLRDAIQYTPTLLKRWIQLYFRKEGRWPTVDSPAIWVYELHEGWQVVEGESWRKVNQALIHGTRGLKELKGSSLSKFKQAHGLAGEGPPVSLKLAA